MVFKKFLGGENMKIQSIRFLKLPELYKMLYISFGKKEKDFFVPFVENNPFFNNYYFTVLEEDNKIVSSIQICELQTYINGKLERLGGIGQVGTLKQYRRRGYATLLLKECIKRMKEINCSYSLLFGVASIYQKNGWIPLPIKNYNFEDIDLKSKVSKNVIPYNEKYKYNLYDIHAEFIKNFNLPVCRNFLYWEYYWKRFKAKGTKTFLLKEKGQIVAYLTLKKEKDQIQVFEYGSYEKDNEEHFIQLFSNALNNKKVEKAYVSYANDNYVPVKVLREYSENMQVDILTSFKVRKIKKNFNWKKIAKNALFFIGDSF